MANYIIQIIGNGPDPGTAGTPPSPELVRLNDNTATAQPSPIYVYSNTPLPFALPDDVGVATESGGTIEISDSDSAGASAVVVAQDAAPTQITLSNTASGQLPTISGPILPTSPPTGAYLEPWFRIDVNGDMVGVRA